MPKLTPFPQQSHFAIFLHLPFMIHTRISSRYNSLAKSAKKSKGFSKINPEIPQNRAAPPLFTRRVARAPEKAAKCLPASCNLCRAVLHYFIVSTVENKRFVFKWRVLRTARGAC
jgi:hypothetical protein